MVAGLCGVQASTWQRLFTTVDGLQNNQVRQIVELPNGQMDNVDYTVDQLAQDAAMSRTDLYRKMQQMLGITPNNFLRNVN